MIPTTLQIRDYAETERVTYDSATRTLLNSVSRTDLIAYAVEHLTKAVNRAARKAFTEQRIPDLNPNQLVLFEYHHSLPPMVRIPIEGGEIFVHWQNATLDESAESVRYLREEHLRQAGMLERIEQRIYQTEQPRDVPIGLLLFGDIRCAVCGRQWELNDPLGPFELAHDEPVAGRSGNPERQWAHRKCNQGEGTK